MSLYRLILITLLAASCNQSRIAPVRSDVSEGRECIDTLVAVHHRPLGFVEVSKEAQEVDYSSDISFGKGEIVIEVRPEGHAFRIRGNLVKDTTLSNWARGNVLDAPNMRIYRFRFGEEDQYLLVNHNSLATGLATNYFEQFIYIPSRDISFSFVSLSGDPRALGVSVDSSLEFARADFADEYFQSNRTYLPVVVEKYEYDGAALTRTDSTGGYVCK